MEQINLNFKLWNNRKPIKGDLLLAAPFLGDANFDHAVVLLCDFTPEGAFGFVLNHTANLFLSDVIDGFEDIEIPLFIGGPVEKSTLHVLHSASSNIEASISVTDKISWGGSMKEMKEKLKNGLAKKEDFRFFLGYSGWGNDQLISELKSQSWALTSSDEVSIFEESDEKLWRNIYKKMGGKYKIVANTPLDPSFN